MSPAEFFGPVGGLFWVIYWLSGMVVMAESLNKLERTDPLRRDLTPRERVTDWLKAVAWSLFALGGAGALASPLINRPPDLQDVCVLVGFCVLIVRTRIKEG